MGMEYPNFQYFSLIHTFNFSYINFFILNRFSFSLSTLTLPKLMFSILLGFIIWFSWNMFCVSCKHKLCLLPKVQGRGDIFSVINYTVCINEYKNYCTLRQTETEFTCFRFALDKNNCNLHAHTRLMDDNLI